MVSTSRTTTVGLVVGDKVILAADKRASAGPLVAHKRVKKILRITDNVAMTISGLVADAQFLADNLAHVARSYEIDVGRPIKVSTLASFASLLLSAYLRYSPFVVQVLIGGVDAEGPSLYYVDLFGSISKEKYASTGSGSPVALGVLEQGYRDGMSLEEAKELAFNAVRTALQRDGFSGEGVDIVVISREGLVEETRILSPEIVPR